jgi:hypothetical protein
MASKGKGRGHRGPGAVPYPVTVGWRLRRGLRRLDSSQSLFGTGGCVPRNPPTTYLNGHLSVVRYRWYRSPATIVIIPSVGADGPVPRVRIATWFPTSWIASSPSSGTRRISWIRLRRASAASARTASSLSSASRLATFFRYSASRSGWSWTRAGRASLTAAVRCSLRASSAYNSVWIAGERIPLFMASIKAWISRSIRAKSSFRRLRSRSTVALRRLNSRWYSAMNSRTRSARIS